MLIKLHYGERKKENAAVEDVEVWREM